jgi:hypothetical protein
VRSDYTQFNIDRAANELKLHVYTVKFAPLFKVELQGTEYNFHIRQVSALYKINNIFLLAGTIEFVHIEQVSALFTFLLGQVLLYLVRIRRTEMYSYCKVKSVRRK